MRIKDMVWMGLRNLFRRKARTSLTIVGMAIGIILIMILASISIGVRQTIDKYIMENGQMSMIYIRKHSYSVDDDGNYTEKQQVVDDALVQKIKGIKHVRAVSPISYVYVELRYGKYRSGTSLRVMDSTTFADFDFPELAYGSYPTEENRAGIIFGYNAADWTTFYDPTSYVHREKTVDFTREKITFSFDSYAQYVSDNKKLPDFPLVNYGKMAYSDNYMFNYEVFIDIEYYKSLLSQHANALKLEYRKQLLKSMDEYNEILINVDNMRNVTEVEDQIKDMGYETDSNMQYIQPMIDTADMLQNVLIGIGLVAVLVAAINIANTMITSIYERTKEIGIMKVLGCLVSDVKKLFLFESAVLGLIGGLFGIAVSYICSYVINKYGSEFLGSLIQTGINQGDKASVIPWWLPLLISAFAILIGVLSGYMPARRATKISAIEAMKSEN